jgi:tRNA modification GTPase
MSLKELPKTDIIAAIATATGRGGIGVVRISGTNLEILVNEILGVALEPRYAKYTPFLDVDGNIIDFGIALLFPSPNSYTGEDVLELHGHGGSTVLHLVLKRCIQLGARIAEPGEFTKRAFLNDKLDLAQAEAVVDLIDATTAQAARSAIRSLKGEFSEAIFQLVAKLIELRIQIEATIDFPEENTEINDGHNIATKLVKLIEQLELIQIRAKQGSLLREGAHIVLIGKPNVGKSTLLNRMSGEDIALVSEIPGTTRDSIKHTFQINGIPIHLIDTAGLRTSEDPIEQMGMARTKLVAQSADLIIWLKESINDNIQASEFEYLPPGIPRLDVVNKIDLIGEEPRSVNHNGDKTIYISAKTCAGLDILKSELLNMLGWQQEDGVYTARERHLSALSNANLHLKVAEQQQCRIEILAEELRLAQESLNQITGEFTADDLLGEIFSRFCIGK